MFFTPLVSRLFWYILLDNINIQFYPSTLALIGRITTPQKCVLGCKRFYGDGGRRRRRRESAARHRTRGWTARVDRLQEATRVRCGGEGEGISSRAFPPLRSHFLYSKCRV
eukprot:scaffold13898_cov30-Tisochrysis_lutea.AAC.6